MIRIAKFIAETGAASRRDAERMIESGAVRVNGKVVTTPVFFVNEKDRVEINGRAISATAPVRVIAFNKPIDTMTTARDPENRPTIYDTLPKEFKTFKYIGRLDFKTTGLLLLTNNGELARKLTLPESGIVREYEAKLRPKSLADIGAGRAANNLRRFLSPLHSDDSIFETLRRGATIGGVKYAPMEIELISRYPLSVSIKLREGKKNEIRIAFDYIGLPVSKLKRIAYGPIQLKDLAPGKFRELDEHEIKML
ncbi:MAG: rRNA pseudouridine synthase [Alphaproteobacteria bacterium]|nr:rRNA pseudouridine synthase [Alphaproteobacteria bacterium]